MPTYQRFPQLTVNPFHRPSFDSDAYVFRLRGADDPVQFYLQKTKDVQDILADHLTRGQLMRGIGSSWSLSDVGVTPGSLVTTETWTQVFDLQQPGTIDAGYTGSAQDRNGLCLAEAGLCMTDLDEYLMQRQLSVKAHGSNNGQSLVGAASTNTHGGAFQFGAIHDAIVGIHLVASPTESVYLERATYPVLDAAWVTTNLGARKISNDDLFNAAVVSFGSMGVIRSVVIETRPLFTLEARQFQHNYNAAMRAAMTAYDFSGIDTGPQWQHQLVPAWQNGRELYHFEIIFNPNDPANADPATSQAYLNLMLADPDLSGWVAPSPEPADLVPGGTEILAHVLAALGPAAVLVRGLLNSEVEKHFPLGQIRAPIRYMFRGQVPEPRAFASGIGLPADQAANAFDIALRLYRNLNTTLPLLISARFVKGTTAMLGYTHFANTCVLELDGIRGVGVEPYFAQVLAELQNAGIPFALHWGKATDWYNQPGNLQRAYGAAITQWKQCRAQILTSQQLQDVFANDFLRRVGLA
jgi:hypothetical protein